MLDFPDRAGLNLERGTVYRFAGAASLRELLVKATIRKTLVDGYEPYMQSRWNEGVNGQDDVQVGGRLASRSADSGNLGERTVVLV